jgi:hypothetical protein
LRSRTRRCSTGCVVGSVSHFRCLLFDLTSFWTSGCPLSLIFLDFFLSLNRTPLTHARQQTRACTPTNPHGIVCARPNLSRPRLCAHAHAQTPCSHCLARATATPTSTSPELAQTPPLTLPCACYDTPHPHLHRTGCAGLLFSWRRATSKVPISCTRRRSRARLPCPTSSSLPISCLTRTCR